MRWLGDISQEQIDARNALARSARLVKGENSARRDNEERAVEPLAEPKRIERQKSKRRARELSRIPEWRVLKGCADLLASHPRVAFYWRQNTGSFQVAGRYIKFSFRGASDLMAVMKGTAQFWAIECKSTGKKATQDQQAFLDAVVAAGGVGICVDDPKKLAEALNGALLIGDIPASEIPF